MLKPVLLYPNVLLTNKCHEVPESAFVSEAAIEEATKVLEEKIALSSSEEDKKTLTAEKENLASKLREESELGKLVRDLIDTARINNAHGLAAPQIGVFKRVFVTKTDDQAFKVFINPVVTVEEGTPLSRNKEGCVSFPGVLQWVRRPEECSVTALGLDGLEFTVDFDELDAIAVQHENDHLDGILFIDHVSKLEKRYVLKKLIKIKKRYNLGLAI